MSHVFYGNLHIMEMTMAVVNYSLHVLLRMKHDLPLPCGIDVEL